MDMTILSSTIKILCGISLIYFITDTVVSEKYKQYVDIVLGTAVILTVLSPIAFLLNNEWIPSFSASATLPPNDYSSTINGIWQEQSLKGTIEKTLSENFPQYNYIVRLQKPDNKYIIYITIKGNISNDEIHEIRNLISQKTGITMDRVNIYLQNKNIGDDDNG